MPKLVDDYLNEPICYGGEWWPRWKVRKDLERVAAANGAENPRACADRWFQGYERARGGRPDSET